MNIESNSVDSAFYTDLRLSYLHELAGGGAIGFFGNFSNVFDEDPPDQPYYSVFLGHAEQTNAGLFDLLGRSYTGGHAAQLQSASCSTRRPQCEETA